MALPFGTVEIQFSAESSFAENSTSYTTHIPVLSYTFTPNKERIRDASFRSRMNVEGLSHMGPRSASFEFTCYLIGHINPTTGSLAETWQQDLLSDGLGGGNTSQVGATVSSATSSTQFVFGGTAVAGGVLRLGAKGDSRGDGQPGVVNAAGTTTFLTAFGTTPNVGDQVYACQMAYHDESVSASLGTKRFMIGHTTTGAQYHLRGCQLAGLTFNEPLGGMPTVTFRYECAYWTESSVTIPSATAISSHDCAPVAGGSMFIQDFGTTTRATITPSEVNLNLEIGLAPIVGPGGTYADQHIVGWQRTMCKPTLSVLIPWSSTYYTWWDTLNSTISRKHILWSRTAGTGGRDGGWYLPYVHPVGPRPTRDEWNSQLYQRVMFMGSESTTTSTELTRSSVRLFAG